MNEEVRLILNKGYRENLSVEDIKNWSSAHTKVRGDVLLKIMTTMKSKYGVEFMIVPKRNMGAYIIKLLKLGDKNERQ